MMDNTVTPQGSPRGARRGVTLIELMVVVAIIGVLASIAYPAYRESTAKGRRAQATAQLMAAQQWMERFYSENLRYDATTGGTAVTHATQFGGRFSTVPPPSEGTALYTLELTGLTATTFTIIARPTGAMTNDRCGDLTLDHLSRKGTITSHFDGVDAARMYCWR